MLSVVFVGNNADTVFTICVGFLSPGGQITQLQLRQTKEATCLFIV